MRIAYIISAYKYPQQLVRLLRRLETPRSVFVVHVDAKTAAHVYDEMVDGARAVARVHFLDRHTCHWGGFGHVRASLKGIDHLIATGIPFDYAVLFTGQDYPLRPPGEIERFLSDAQGQSFMNHWPLPFPPWGPRGGLDRVEHWHVIGYRRLHLALPLGRRIPGGLRPFGGGTYWCLARRAVAYVHEFVKQNPSYVRFFEHVFIPDEIFFQTIIMNSPLQETIVNNNLRYIDWSREPAPAVLTVDDYDKLVNSGKLFARKFDTTVDLRILDMLDEYIEGQVRVYRRDATAAPGVGGVDAD